ncbi:MAG TPA: GNAT family N-acetyltransferase, partial [Chitinophagaceae bacterium]|nr:GNAT family N-acetyltransferase [Chitinophagaceae bacterium]
MDFSFADKTDIPRINKLVNSAYRGEASRQGWATETDLLDGQRTDEAALEELLNTQDSVIIKCTEEGELIGCVHLQKRKRRMYLGMLTVAPWLQARGLGKALMKAAEDHAASQNCVSVYMTVITQRHELIQWYIRRGYHLTSKKQDFPADTRFGIPKQPLELVVMEKHLPQILEHISIRTTLKPGDIGYVTYLHGHLYQQEYQYGISFEAYVA